MDQSYRNRSVGSYYIWQARAVFRIPTFLDPAPSLFDLTEEEIHLN